MPLRIGIDYLKELEAAGAVAQCSFDAFRQTKLIELSVIGTSLSALYQAATCHRKCHDNGHVLEGLSGRAHNLGSAAVQLARRGMYDESFNLIRGVGEIANLVAAFSNDKNALRRWLESSAETRRREFQPARVRKMLRNGNGVPLLADDDWYSRLCES